MMWELAADDTIWDALDSSVRSDRGIATESLDGETLDGGSLSLNCLLQLPGIAGTKILPDPAPLQLSEEFE